METIIRWEAKRAGASITVRGTGPAGEVRKVTGIETIKPNAAGEIIATGRYGSTYLLAVSTKA